jgi:C-terminal processing protease CtpA/Prc
VGERSFGKGSVQHLLRLTGHKAAIKLTVAYYHLPDGRVIHREDDGRGGEAESWGIDPDIEVRLTPEESSLLQQFRSSADSPIDLKRDRQLAAALDAARSRAR